MRSSRESGENQSAITLSAHGSHASNFPPLFAVPAGTSAVPRHSPLQACGPSCRALAPRTLRVFPPRAYQGGRRPRVPPPRNRPTRQPPMGQAPGGTGDAAEKMCFIFPIHFAMILMSRCNLPSKWAIMMPLIASKGWLAITTVAPLRGMCESSYALTS
jgi:hypothetical protein